MESFTKQSFLAMFYMLLMATSSLGQLKHKTLVRVTNEVGSDLTVHCKSKDDDLGMKILHPKGSYEFSFWPNFMLSTLFFCRMGWGQQSHYIDIYIAHRDNDKCGYNCFWVVKPTGPCMLYPKDKQTCYPWKS
ncbi:S-protein homolog 5-like [Mercurialis annua]|uniref:S-protein homolog 5-like n=1 Tax=Mercurialis annua TaxID=3986 RepID=UPI00215EC31A|nr:S-protein homolog 5-like [Mercurialis annua]